VTARQLSEKGNFLEEAWKILRETGASAANQFKKLIGDKPITEQEVETFLTGKVKYEQLLLLILIFS
jgi:hypothetical protein